MPTDLLRHGDRGDEVRRAQEALEQLGFTLPDDEPGVYGEATVTAVRAFQKARGIGVDGIIGPVTRRELVDAQHVLGGRQLLLESPLLRGDDVRALQDRLTTLGFDPGKTDGIFGPDTMSALRNFQHEYGLTEDGVCGPETVRALRGLKIMSGDTPIRVVRERERMQPRADGLLGMRIFLDPGPAGEDVAVHEDPASDPAFGLCGRIATALRDQGAEAELSRSENVVPDDSTRARLANTLNTDIVLAVRVRDELPAGTARIRSFGHSRYQSVRGDRAATLLAEALLEFGAATELTHEASTVPILRETRATAVVLDLSPGCALDDVPEALLAGISRCATVGAFGAHV